MKQEDYQIGDIVCIRERKDIPESCIFGWVPYMGRFSCENFVISRIELRSGGRFEFFFNDMPDDMKNFHWSADMFDLVGRFSDNSTPEDWLAIMA